ncbi:hypothetical protein SELMODRAFT_117224 [Selaginella moellendorffii]|uniref:O-fucosyltransferase family protein n=1 Tax=Selaginella moellendorffii TaxID=88036 RepID=D8SHG6_SELML|nr:hypothetical protein SELMODRAFT_117224 [Selaginella moellendorffii]
MNKSVNLDLDSLSYAPHIQDCKRSGELHAKLDGRGENGKWPPWSLSQGSSILGGDDENLPLTRLVQHDLWLNQHPKDCSNARFLMADWFSQQTPTSIGVGSELVYLSAMFSMAVMQKRVLVTKAYHGANHSGCLGLDRARWSCYFLPEASSECIARALELSSQKEPWDQGLLVNFDYNHGWTVPRLWGEPWKRIEPSVELDGVLMADVNGNNERRWWRAQVFRYLMRFPSEYLCNLLNVARNEAFGEAAARLILKNYPQGNWNSNNHSSHSESPMEANVWSSYGPWIPRPLVSIHVRQGDKNIDMEVHPFKDYMKLAMRLRKKFPHINCVWLSTEMQNVIDESKEYEGWNFFFTDIKRQVGATSMAEYMASLGKRKNFENSYVNLLMAADCDFFVGVLGSTWSYAIDCLRMTSGKVKAGFLTVNPVNYLL